MIREERVKCPYCGAYTELEIDLSDFSNYNLLMGKQVVECCPDAEDGCGLFFAVYWEYQLQTDVRRIAGEDNDAS
jgi:hypothetical protein